MLAGQRGSARLLRMDLRAAYRALDPARSAAEEHYVERPGDPVGLLRMELGLRQTPLRVLVGGQRGVGKTTEMARLGALLGLGLDAPTVLVDEYITKQEPPPCDQRRVGALFVDVGSLSVNEYIASLVATLRITFPHLAEFPPKRHERLAANRFEEYLFEQFPPSEPRPLFLLDGLEKVSPSTAEPYLTALRDWPAHVVMVAPLSVLLAPEFSSTVSEWDRVLLLPAVSVRGRDGQPAAAGVALMRQVIERRVGDDTFTSASLDLLIDQAAGLHRETLSLAQQACLRAAAGGQTQVDEGAVQKVLTDKRHEYSFHLTPEDIAYLRQVAAAQRISGDPRALALLGRNLLISYQDESAWFDVHPLIRPLLA